MKTKYILHGGYTREDNSENTKFFSECFADTPNKTKVLVVLFASENDGSIEYYENFCKRLKTFTDKDLEFIKANREDFASQIEQVNVVFLQGGDTNRILEALKSYPQLADMFKGKTIVGSSAGAYALANLGTSHEEIYMREGLNILPLRVVCHYQSDRLPPSKTSLEEIQNAKQELELVLLEDYKYKVFWT